MGSLLTRQDLTSHLVGFMSKKTNIMKNAARADVAWSGSSSATSRKKGESVTVHKTIAPAAYRAGDMKTMAEELLEALISAVKANAGIVRILPAHGQNLQIISSLGLPPELFEVGSAIDLNCEKCGKADLGHGIYSADISACKTRPNCRYANCQHQSIILAPLETNRSPDNQIGIITLFFNVPPESLEHVSKTVQAFARLLSTLIEQHKSNREEKRVDLIAERQSIANEIHDSLAQTLVYARMRTNMLIESIQSGNALMAAKYAHDIDEALETGQKTVRELISDFRCEMDPSGLLQALQNLTKQFCERNNIALEYINRVVDFDLPLEYEIQIYYIVREALANIANHSGATHARLIIDTSGENFIIIIEDNGRGGCIFTPVEGHYGMMIMRERAARMNGEIKIESTEGSGTLVQLSFQVANARKERD
jgi:two-component system, NarL family, nitrate/nitrite sensor histidine kinase NarX